MKKVSIKNKRIIKVITFVVLSILAVIAIAFAVKGFADNKKAVYAESAPQVSF